MPAGGGPSGPGSTILAFLAVFAVGGSSGIVYTIAKQNTIRENMIALFASVAVLLGFVATLLDYLPLEAFLVLLGVSSITVVVGFEQHEQSGPFS